jgi:hypothetical protein
VKFEMIDDFRDNRLIKKWHILGSDCYVASLSENHH